MDLSFIVFLLILVLIIFLWNTGPKDRYSLPKDIENPWHTGKTPEQCRSEKEMCFRDSGNLIGGTGECIQEYEYCMEYAR